MLVKIDEDMFATVTMNRPDVHNAFSDHVITELNHVFTDLRNNKGEERPSLLCQMTFKETIY